MARPSNAPRLGEGQEFFLNLYPDVALELHLYCDVVGAQKTKVINRAVHDLIVRDLEENRGFRERFDERKAQVLEEARCRKDGNGPPFRVVKGTSPTSPRRRRKRDN